MTSSASNWKTLKIVIALPGILLSALVAWFGIQSSEWIGESLLGFEKSPISGIMMAIIFGLLLGNLINIPIVFKPGITYSVKRLLKLGIVLLGIRLSLGAIVQVGLIGLPVIIICISGALLITRWLSNRLNLSPRLGTLIAVGSSICGATAIVATGPTIDADEEEITYAIANITVFGIIAMFVYPYLANALFADQSLSAGLFLGTSIHETAQVAGSGFIYSQLFENEQVFDVANIAKLVRNVFMIAVIPGMAYIYRRETDAGKGKRINLLNLFPTFILGFLLVALIRTVGDATADQSGQAFGILAVNAWDELTSLIKQIAEVLLAVAMAGVGLGTSLRSLRKLGIKPFYVGFGAALSVAGLSIGALVLLQALGIAS